MKKNQKKQLFRSYAMVWTVVTSTVMLGFTALSVDMGYTYHSKTQLQRCADAAAMAAASQLSAQQNMADKVYEEANQFASENKVGDVYPTLDASDVVLGRAVTEDSGKTTFNAGQEPYDAVKVTVRMTQTSPNGAIPLFFGKAIGKGEVELSASAVAKLVPRDIGLIIDLSRSMDYDSQLKFEKTGDPNSINIKQVWQDLGSPTFGNMTTFHNNASEMPTWSTTTTSTLLTKLALNGVAYPYPVGSWSEYVNYVKGSSVNGCSINSSSYPAQKAYLKRYGLRTFVHYLLEVRCKQTETPILANCREQPVWAVKEAVDELTQYLLLMDSSDHLSLHSYAQTAKEHYSLTSNFLAIRDMVYQRQAGEYSYTTNIYSGIMNAQAELTSSNARSAAKKVIFLLTDGNANVDQYGNYTETGGYNAAVMAAESAADLGIQIFTISLGTDADQTLMGEVASIGKGVHYHVPTLDVEQYEEELKEVFRTLGGKRPVQLVN